MTRKRIRITLIVLASVVVASVVAWQLFIHNVYVSFDFCAETEFGKMPADDQLLVEWLKAQPGVVSRTVHVKRFGPKEHTVEVMWIQSQTLAGNPPYPDLNQKCAELGYVDPKSLFRNCRDPK